MYNLSYWRLPTCIVCSSSLVGMGEAEFCGITCELIYEAEMKKYQDTPSEEFPANHAAHLPKGWSHIMYVLCLNEENTCTPSYGYNADIWPEEDGHFIWDGTYNEEHWSFR